MEWLSGKVEFNATLFMTDETGQVVFDYKMKHSFPLEVAQELSRILHNQLLSNDIQGSSEWVAAREVDRRSWYTWLTDSMIAMNNKHHCDCNTINCSEENVENRSKDTFHFHIWSCCRTVSSGDSNNFNESVNMAIDDKNLRMDHSDASQCDLFLSMVSEYDLIYPHCFNYPNVTNNPNDANNTKTATLTSPPTTTTIPVTIENIMKEEDPLELITIGISTCKRLQYFLATAKLLEESITVETSMKNSKEKEKKMKLYHSIIYEVLVIDDGSSLQDREIMRNEFPQYNYVLKGSYHKGHADTMNMFVELVQTRYFLYLEDDWSLLSRPWVHASLYQSLYQSKVMRPDNNIQYFDNVMTSADTLLHHQNCSMHQTLLNSVTIILNNHLANQNNSYFDKIVQKCFPTQTFETNIDVALIFINLLKIARSILYETRYSNETIHQILFNEQSNRYCAIGNTTGCDADKIGRGGWERISPATKIPFSLHEFGLPLMSGAHGVRNHYFSYWPSLSFNPGLWDLHAIKSRILHCKMTPQESQEQITINTTKTAFTSSDIIFDINDNTFEHRFSMMSHAVGLRMGYLPAMIFKHDGIFSAYTLNEIKRSWIN